MSLVRSHSARNKEYSSAEYEGTALCSPDFPEPQIYKKRGCKLRLVRPRELGSINDPTLALDHPMPWGSPDATCSQLSFLRGWRSFVERISRTIGFFRDATNA